jgi:amidase
MAQQDPAAGWQFPNDPLGAFCRENHIAIAGEEHGPLRGLTFAVKDLFDVAGARTGFGHPDWLRTHEPATKTAPAVQRMLDAGATLVGKTLTDELAYSLTGENFHYGTPRNPRAPERVPGGSSSGSASAVAGGLVDFALGSDCGGSVRIPASYCGIFGMRPTHDRIPLEGAAPFASSFDVVGWFTRDAGLLERIGRMLLGDDEPAKPFKRLLLCADAFARVSPEIRDALAPAVKRVADAVGAAPEIATLAPEGLDAWRETFRIVQASEIWASLGGWITEHKPVFGPGVRERFAAAAQISAAQAEAARAQRLAIRARVEGLLRPGTLLCLPTSPRVAPLKGLASDAVEVEYRNQALNILCISGLCGLPQISLPFAELDGLPLGLSIVTARGGDVDLLALATASAARSA